MTETETTAALEARAAEIVRTYDAQGEHRTGTAVDLASADWLAGEVEATGVTAQRQSLAFERLVPVDCFLRIGNRRIDGVPVFDRGTTDAGGVSGRLGAFGSDAAIGVAEAGIGGPGGKNYVANVLAEIRDCAHDAVILLTQGACPGLTLCNANDFLMPSGPPVLQISGSHADWLTRHVEACREATVTVHCARESTEAVNVTAEIAGSDPALPPVIVSTPRSGWWQCAGERGGGLVCWLEALRGLAAARPARRCLFAAFAGHELGLLGGNHFIRSHPSLAAENPAWLHFGANLGAPGKPINLQSSDPDLADLAVPLLASAGLDIVSLPTDATPRGEATIAVREGIPYIAPICGSDVFHHPADRWPTAVDIATLARCAAGFAEIARQLADRP